MRWSLGPENPGGPMLAVDQDDPKLTPIPVGDETWKATFDPQYRGKNPFLAGRGMLGADYRSNMDGNGAMGYTLGQGLRRAFDAAYQTDGRALATNGIAGAALGLGSIAALNTFRESRDKEPLGWKSRALAALLGAGAGTALTVQMRGGVPQLVKSGSSGLEQMRQDIMARASELDYETRNRVSGALVRLSPADLATLHQLAMTAFGASAGALIARWLSGKGLMPLLLGGTIGAIAGHYFGRRPTNALGRESLDSYR